MSDETQTPTAPESAPAPTQPEAPVAPAASTAQEPEPISFMDALDRALEEAEKPKEDKAAEEPKSEEPKKEEKAEESDDAEVKNMTPNAGAKFKEIKAEAKAARARVAELEAKLAEVEKSPKPDAAEAEKLQAAITEREAKIAEYEKELAISRFEATTEFKTTVVEPLAAILGVVERFAKKYEVPEKKLMSILSEADPDAQGDLIVEMASGFSERDRVSLYQLADDYSAVMAHRDELRANASQALAAREATKAAEAAKSVEESKKTWKSATSKVWETLKAKIPLPGEGEEKTALENEIFSKVSEASLDSANVDVKAFAAFAGALVPHMAKQNKLLSTEVAELKEALKKYQAATPGAGAGAETKSAALDDGMGFLDAIEARFRGV